MARRSYRPEQIIKNLREAKVLLSQASTVGGASRKIGVTDLFRPHRKSTRPLLRGNLLLKSRVPMAEVKASHPSLQK